MNTHKILIDIPTNQLAVIDKMANETQRTRKAMCQILIANQLKSLNYKPQLDLSQELK